MARMKYDWKLVKASQKDKAAFEMVQAIRRDFHPDLRDVKLGVFFKPTGEPAVSIAGAWQELLSDVSAALILPWEAWQKWDEKEREARIDDLLSRLSTNERTGHVVKVRPDVVGNLAVFNRRGAYNDGLEKVEAALKQHHLPDMGPRQPEKPAEVEAEAAPEAAPAKKGKSKSNAAQPAPAASA